jgi:hypothetical protein
MVNRPRAFLAPIEPVPSIRQTMMGDCEEPNRSLVTPQPAVSTPVPLILLRLRGLAAGRFVGGTRHIPSCRIGTRTTCTIRHRSSRCIDEQLPSTSAASRSANLRTMATSRQENSPPQSASRVKIRGPTTRASKP